MESTIGCRSFGCVLFERSHQQDLRDLVWTAAQFVWANGGESPGFIPTRYPGSENATDSSLRLARKTEWIDRGEDLYTGSGQRMFATDQAEIALTETRKIELSQPSP